jgi:hypothetical protein
MRESSDDRSPDLSSVQPISEVISDERESTELSRARREARDYIEFYDWVFCIQKEFLGVAIDGVVYIFLFEITPARDGVDSWVWVIVGDVPPAYITCEDAKTPFEALDGYIGAMEEWVRAARADSSVADLIPVNVAANPENAQKLEQRLQFLDSKVLPLLDR